jgi:alpha-dioxygenase
LVPGARLGLEVWGFRGGIKWTDGDVLAVYHDRKCQNCQYNEFRRRMFMSTIQKWEDLTIDKETLATIRELYDDDVERLDLLVGLLVEKEIPGFAISETAFFIFLIMASR